MCIKKLACKNTLEYFNLILTMNMFTSVICQFFQGPLDPKDGAVSVHVGTSQTPAYYPYEYTFGQYPYDRYG